MERFHEALDLNEPFAFVGKPCDISAISQLSKIDPRVNKQCKYLLTLVCGGFAEFTKAQDFIESFKVKEEELSIFRYRGYGNPGRMYIKTKDGREYDREYNSFWGEESTWRVPFRCKICPDAIGESADVAALDTWRGGSPKGEDEGFNAAIVRTKKGLDLMNDAAKAGFIHIGNKLKIEDIDDFQPHQVNKKKAVYARHLGMTKNDSPTINTKGLRIKELYKLNSEDFNKKEGEHIGPVISETQYNKIQTLIKKGIDEGAKLVAGGPGKPEGLEKGYFVKPTVFADVNNNMDIARTEIFGPVLSVMPFETEEEAIQIANDTPYGLTNYIQTQDKEKVKRVARKLRSGMVDVNGAGIAVDAPFGGFKHSGIGREAGEHGLEEFLEVKSVGGGNN